MKRTRAQNPKLQDPQDPSAATNPGTKPQQRRTKQPRQPKAAAKKTAAAAAREVAAAAAAMVPEGASAGVEMVATVPDVCRAGGGDEAAGQSSEWEDLVDGGLSNGSWWTFGVEEEKLLGWFPFVEEDFRCVAGGRGDAADAAAFDDDIWRIHQIYEIPSYAAK